MKKFFKYAGIVLLWILGLLIIFILWGEVANQYKYNHKYSIAMPELLGSYTASNNFIRISGLLKTLNEEPSSLNYSETYCDTVSNECYENRIAITRGMGSTYIFPYSEDFKIKFKDNNKIIFSNFIERKVGEIDLNAKTLTYTVKPIDSRPNQITVITDNKEIEKLEKKIIRKYLKRKWFK